MSVPKCAIEKGKWEALMSKMESCWLWCDSWSWVVGGPWLLSFHSHTPIAFSYTAYLNCYHQCVPHWGSSLHSVPSACLNVENNLSRLYQLRLFSRSISFVFPGFFSVKKRWRIDWNFTKYNVLYAVLYLNFGWQNCTRYTMEIFVECLLTSLSDVLCW